MNAITQSPRPRLAGERAPEYEAAIGQNVPDPIAVPWSGRRRRARGTKVLALSAIAGVAIFILAAGGGNLPV